MAPDHTLTMPVGISRASTSIGQITADGVDELVQQAARQAGLDEVPVTEQHGVGDRPEEGGPDERPQQREGDLAVGVDGRGEQPDGADDHRDEVEPRVELGDAGVGRVACRSDGDGRRRSLDAGHRRDPSRPPVVLRRAGRAPRPSAGRPRRASTPRQASPVPAADASRTGFGSVEQAGGDGAEGDGGVHAAEQPAVAEPDLAPPSREPAERHPADRPLQQHRGGLEADHAAEGTVASRPSTAYAVGA